MKKITLVVTISIAMGLAACGGGSSNGGISSTSTGAAASTTTTASNSATASTGSIIEKLDTNSQFRVNYYSVFGNGSAVLDPKLQNDQGVVTGFGGYQLTGNIVANELTGNKNFTEARISSGQLTYTSSYDGKVGTTDLANDLYGYYYYVFKPLTTEVTVPTSKTINCTDLHVTRAHWQYVYGAPTQTTYIDPSLQSGSITLNPNGQIDVKFTMQSNSDITTFRTEFPWSAQYQYGTLGTLGIVGTTGESSQIGSAGITDNGANSYIVGAIYTMTLSSGAQYRGAISMTCNA